MALPDCKTIDQNIQELPPQYSKSKSDQFSWIGRTFAVMAAVMMGIALSHAMKKNNDQDQLSLK